jgi:hypothetical protein
MIVVLAVVFLLSAATDWLGILYHRARERGHRWRGAALSMLLEGLPWIALYFAITEDYRVIIASVLGSGVGSFFGFPKVQAPLQAPRVVSLLGFRPPAAVGVDARLQLSFVRDLHDG